MLILQQREQPACTVRSVAYSPDGRWLAAANDLYEPPRRPGMVKVWDLHTRQSPTVVYTGKSGARSVAFGPDGLLAAGFQDQSVRLFKCDEPLRTQKRFTGHSFPPTALCFSPEGQWLIVATGNNLAAPGRLYFWKWQYSILDGVADWGVWSLAYTPDGSALVVGGQRSVVWLDALALTHRRLRVLETPKVARALALTPDGTTLATTAGRSIKLWDVETMKEIVTLKGHEDIVWALAFSTDGRILASGSGDGAVRFWDVWTHQLRAAFDWEIGHVHTLAFSPDGMTAAAGGDGTDNLVLWDVGEY
jgi:WD40 repeat protein